MVIDLILRKWTGRIIRFCGTMKPTALPLHMNLMQYSSCPRSFGLLHYLNRFEIKNHKRITITLTRMMRLLGRRGSSATTGMARWSLSLSTLNPPSGTSNNNNSSSHRMNKYFAVLGAMPWHWWGRNVRGTCFINYSTTLRLLLLPFGFRSRGPRSLLDSRGYRCVALGGSGAEAMVGFPQGGGGTAWQWVLKVAQLVEAGSFVLEHVAVLEWEPSELMEKDAEGTWLMYFATANNLH